MEYVLIVEEYVNKCHISLMSSLYFLCNKAKNVTLNKKRLLNCRNYIFHVGGITSTATISSLVEVPLLEKKSDCNYTLRNINFFIDYFYVLDIVSTTMIYCKGSSIKDVRPKTVFLDPPPLSNIVRLSDTPPAPPSWTTGPYRA